ncbi:uncharacterized protein LOC129892086 [Solanum dulcamara]|uniref:uncharacterized protein LOC129892086 n=1 Tax=Solanum dulcamara TaxID=45834 RepID=UPI0024863367|nr:uncharacterized protein LOC129892086 [Solanum dulcamara]
MAIRRSSFLFRLPWSQDEPSTRPIASTTLLPATSTTNLSTDETPTSNKPPDPTKNTTPGIPTSPTQAGTKSNQHPNTSISPPRPIATSTSLTGETQIPFQPSNMNSTSTNSPARPKSQTTTSNPTTPKISQKPPFRPAGTAPSPKNRASRNESQSSSSHQATNKSRILSPLASPSDTSTKSRLSQSLSSSRLTPQSPATTSTSSPARKAPQVLSTKASQESSDSPSVVKTQMQEKNQAATLPSSPPKSLQEISGPSSKSPQAQSTILDKKEPTEQMKLQTKEVTMSDAVSEAKVSFTDKTMQPTEVSVLKSTMTGTTEGPSEKSRSSSISGESKLLKESASNIQEIKEMDHEAIGKDYGAGEQVQQKQAYMVKQEEATKDHSLVNPVSKGRQTRASASQTRNKIISTGSSQKTAVYSEPHIPLHKEIKDNISKVLNRVAVGGGKQETAGKTPVNVITLAGDNRGASMQLGSDSSTKGGRIYIHRGYKINPDESADATTDGEGRRSKDEQSIDDQTVAAYVNCNVQGINNSISYNSSITERNPGVRMSIPRVPSEPVHSTRLFDAHKAEFSFTPARTIKRRCLRGLFLESSDSDPDKPRRHGCRFGCNDKKK